MTDRIERELVLDAPPEAVWDAITGPGWLAEEVHFDLRPGGEASFRSGESFKRGWVEEADERVRLAFWWESDGEPATRVELTIEACEEGSMLKVSETRPLDVLDLVGVPLPGAGGARFGPALVAA
jgi:uncharacterized protein YndB with AHSA1/START domain